MKVREVKKFVKEELYRDYHTDAKFKWRRHTGMLEMYMKDPDHKEWHEVISIDIDHIKSARYSDNLLKSNLKRTVAALKRKYGQHKTPKVHQKGHRKARSNKND